nr:hypothetical protein B0A51_09330 [Rachicladosporium sp. CCFEE 5018]
MPSKMATVARNDYEQTNLARPPSGSRRSESHDRSTSTQQPARTESSRTSSGHARTQSRYDPNAPQTAPPASNGASVPDNRSSNPTNLRRRTTVDTQTGHWDLGKTIGAGSMGKVKLARNKETGEQVAVKIVPIASTDGEHRTQAERERADHSKEVRTAREAAIVTLVDHPYICGMRDVVRTNYHWYMLFEYVNGGQMLDYIISHGRLKEKQARKFGRQIASALDYCHRNSIVHRDLKIENILISKTGDIKIIDFGLSNLFSPRSHLKTFCGSLYFAAPELLQAKAYTGPEVDIWSFGIVLYVLVCGKVPFDDQSMPQLHAKIKKGIVEYPPWLTPECKNLIARMLNTDPQQRATLSEILTHPWMLKGFSGPAENYIPQRRALQLPLDPTIVDKMTGFDFGSAESITTRLTKVLESEDYQRAVRSAERKSVQQTPELERKRGVFDFYKRRNSTTSRDTLNTPSTEAVQVGTDPTNAFDPLISVYYLVQEKREREMKEKNPGALEMPTIPGSNPLEVPGLPSAPQAAYTNPHAHEMAGEKPSGGRSRPRARTHGEDEVTEGMKNVNINAAPSPTNPAIVEPMADQQQQAPQPVRRESAAVGLLRRFSTRRSKEPTEPMRERPDRSHPPPSLAVYAPSETPKKSFSMRRTRDSSTTGLRPESAESKQADMLSPPGALSPAVDGTRDRKRTGGLGRSVSVNSSDIRRRLTRRGVSEGGPMRPPVSSQPSYDGRKETIDQGVRPEQPTSDIESRPTPPPKNSRTKSLGHSRKESMQMRRTRRDGGRTSDVREETEEEIKTREAEVEAEASQTEMKPVYLKGLFSVSTTSSRPLPIIRADIIRVLRQLGVEYKEIRGGFACRHVPSVDVANRPTDGQALSGAAPLSPEPQTHRRKISFGGFRRDAERDDFRSTSTPQRTVSKTNPRDHSYTTEDEISDDDQNPPSSAYNKQTSSQRAAGETTTHVQSDFGASMVPLKFEVLLVKVPLLSLHGIQFKKVDGGTWRYKNMAERILGELRL